MPGKPPGNLIDLDVFRNLIRIHERKADPHPKYVLEAEMEEKLDELLIELKKMNLYLATLTGEEVTDNDVVKD